MSVFPYGYMHGCTIEQLERMRDDVDTANVHMTNIQAMALKLGYQAMIEHMRQNPYTCDMLSRLAELRSVSGPSS